MNRFIDLSQTIVDDIPIFPGDTKTSLFQTKYLSIDKYNEYRLEASMHSGTHIDGPMHLTEIVEFISDLSLNSFIGPGCLLDVRNQPVIKMKPEYREMVKENSIVLLYTGFEQMFGKAKYFTDYPVVDIELSQFLITKKIKTLGMDTPSPDKSPFLIHRLLLENQIYIIENLTNLSKLNGLLYFEVIAFPLKIKADSSIARVVARLD